jgi:hypothetical protein
LLGLFDSFLIVGANQRFKMNKMSIAADGVDPILCHPRWSPSDGRILLLFRAESIRNTTLRLRSLVSSRAPVSLLYRVIALSILKPGATSTKYSHRSFDEQG